MYKRILIIYFVIMCFLFTNVLRLFYIAGFKDDYVNAAVNQQSYKLFIASKRGDIFDCNLNRLTDNKSKLVAVVEPSLFIDPIQSLEDISMLSFESYFNLKRSVEKNKPFTMPVFRQKSDIKGLTVFRVNERYNFPQIASHLIGYSGKDGGASGLEYSYNDYLKLTSGDFYAKASINAVGKQMSFFDLKFIDNNYTSKSGLVLTVDKNIQKAAETAANKYIKSGAVIVTDIKTGEIKALVSRPDFNPNDITKYLNSPSGELVNRALVKYNVGSIFKIIVTAAILEKYGHLPDFKYYCKGFVDISGKRMACHKETGHGTVDYTNAFMQSCNPYFIKVVSKYLTISDINKMCRNFGMGETITLAPNMVTQKATLSTEIIPTPPILLANSSIGQGDIMLSILDIAKIINVVANNGKTTDFSLIKGFLNNSELSLNESSKIEKQVISDNTANIIKDLMIKTVESGTGSYAKPEVGGAGGKTASAETGWLENGEPVIHGLFAGFYPAVNPKYSIVAICENGRSGSASAAPAFKMIADSIKQ